MKDFFVSYNGKDRAWAEWIAWELEEAGYSVVIQAWDFRPGGNFVLEMQKASSEAERTVAVLSPNYLSAQFTQPEWAAAFAQDPTGEKGILLPVRILPCKLQGLLPSIIYIDLVEKNEEEARNAVLAGVKRERAKPTEKPKFPSKMQHEVVSGKPHFPSNAQPLSAVNLPQNLPRSGVVQFVGRQTKMDELHEKLQQNERLAITAVKGMGGIGKTELALQYSRYHYEQGTYPGGVCWLRARDEQVNIGGQITTFAHVHLGFKPPKELDLSQQVAYCWQRWSGGDVLVVFDNVTDYRDIESCLPPADPRFKVLLTTRSNLGRSVSSLDIDILGEEAASDLLRSLLPEEDRRVTQDLDIAQALCRKLGYLPLGIELVGRYLARKLDLSLVEMQERLEKKGLGTRALDRTEPGMTSRLGVWAAFDLSWQELDEQAQELACLLSLFAPAPVPWVVFQACLPEDDSEELEDLRDEQLVKLSLLKHTGEGVYQLHQLLREFFREKLKSLEGAEELKRAYCQMLVIVAQQIPVMLTREFVEEVLPVMPHMLEVATTLLPLVEDENLVWPFVALGRFYAGQGAYAQAQPWYEQCLAVCQERLGKEHPSVGASLINLAELHKNQGKYDKAEPLYVKALEMNKRFLGEEHPDTALSFNSLAALYRDQGYYEQAKPLFERALAIREKVLGPEHPDVAQSLNSLAVLYTDQGYYEQAELLYQRSLAIWEKVLGPEHSTVATSLNNLAELYRHQGRYEQAEPLSVRSLDIREKVLRPEHPNVASSLNNLALLYFTQGRYEQAEPLYQRSLNIWEKVLGPEHPDVAASLNNLASLYRNQGRYEQAELMFERSLAIAEKVLGPEHPKVTASLNNLALLYFTQGHYKQAEPLYKRALEIVEKVLGAEHPDVASSLNSLAKLYRNQGHYEQAEPLFERALAIREKVLGLEHPKVSTSLSSLAELYRNQGRYEQAEPLFKSALAIAEKVLGPEHSDVAASLNNLALLYFTQGRYKQAQPLYKRALAIVEKVLGPQHPNTLTTRQNYTNFLKRTKKKGFGSAQ
jgi:tetratricopeptide (TPR) repeat protein